LSRLGFPLARDDSPHSEPDVAAHLVVSAHGFDRKQVVTAGKRRQRKLEQVVGHSRFAPADGKTAGVKPRT